MTAADTFIAMSCDGRFASLEDEGRGRQYRPAGLWRLRFRRVRPGAARNQGRKVFREMADSNSTIGAFLYVINQVVAKLSWHVQPKSQQPLALLASEYFESVMDDMEHTWADFVQEVLSMVIYGYAPVEIVLKERQGEKPDKRFSSRYDDGMIGIRKLAIRSQETILRWIMSDDQNDILGLVQMPWTGGCRRSRARRCCCFGHGTFATAPKAGPSCETHIEVTTSRSGSRRSRASDRERSRRFSCHGHPGRIDQLRRRPERATGRPGRRHNLKSYQDLVKNIKRNTQEGAVMPSDRDEHERQFGHCAGCRAIEQIACLSGSRRSRGQRLPVFRRCGRP